MPEHRWRKKKLERNFSHETLLFIIHSCSIIIAFFLSLKYQWNIIWRKESERRLYLSWIHELPKNEAWIHEMILINIYLKLLIEMKEKQILLSVWVVQLGGAHFANDIDLIKFRLAEFLKHRFVELCPQTSSIAERWYILLEDRNRIAYVEKIKLNWI